MIKILIQKILGWLAGITAEQWQAALSFVMAAHRDTRGRTGEEKRDWVLARLRLAYPDLGGSALNMLLELAVGWVKKYA
jgi:hypothetical protein